MNDLFAANADDLAQQIARLPHPALESAAKMICTAPRVHAGRDSSTSHVTLGLTYAIAREVDVPGGHWIVEPIMIAQGKAVSLGPLEKIFTAETVLKALADFEGRKIASSFSYADRADLIEGPSLARHYSNFVAESDGTQTVLRFKNRIPTPS